MLQRTFLANTGLAIMHRLLGILEQNNILISIRYWLVGPYRNSSLAIANPIDAGSCVTGYDPIQQKVKFDLHSIILFLNCAPREEVYGGLEDVCM